MSYSPGAFCITVSVCNFLLQSLLRFSLCCFLFKHSLCAELLTVVNLRSSGKNPAMAAPMKGRQVGLQPRPSCPTQFAQANPGRAQCGRWVVCILLFTAARIEVNLQRSTTRHRGRVDPRVLGGSFDKCFDHVRTQHATTGGMVDVRALVRVHDGIGSYPSTTVLSIGLSISPMWVD